MDDCFWKPTDEQRRTILLLEALGLIHDLGKMSDAFLKSQEPSSSQTYNHNLLADPNRIPIYKNMKVIPGDAASDIVQEWLDVATNGQCAFHERNDLTTILEGVRFIDWIDAEYNFAELSSLVAKPGLAKQRIDWANVLGKEMQPGLLVGFIHGLSHIEKEGEPDRNKQPYDEVFRASSFGMEERIGTVGVQESTNALKALPLIDIHQIATDFRSEWLCRMRRKMMRGIADNRRPHNEISLWDWGYIAASMTKAAAAYIFRYGWPATLEDLSYRTLRVNLDRVDLYARSDKISDLIGLKKDLDDAFKHVREFLENRLGVCNCFFHDETGFYYLFPDLEFRDNELKMFRKEIQAFFPSDYIPRIHFGQKITAGQLDSKSPLNDPQAVRHLIAHPRQAALREPPTCHANNFYKFNKEWEEERPENSEICSVCGVRPVGYPGQNATSNVERRLAHWANQKKAKNRRVCRICLDRRGRRARDWVRNGYQGTIWTNEVADESGRLALLAGKLGLESWLDGTSLESIQVTKKTTKNASPARLYRIAETARAFWNQVIEDITPRISGQRPFRLTLYPSEKQLYGLGDYHAYEMDVDGLALSVVWEQEKSRFVTAENLAYFVNRWKANEKGQFEIVRSWEKDKNLLIDRLERNDFDVIEPAEFGRSNIKINSVHIEKVEALGGFCPNIPLLAEPSVCMTLIPADKALALAVGVKSQYEQHMGRVRDRLPLSLGLAFFTRRTPIRAALEAGRSMLGHLDQNQWAEWRLKDKTLGSNTCELSFCNGIKWAIPILTGADNVEDEWYPRMFVGDSWENKQAKHVKQLSLQNSRTPPNRVRKVFVKPSRFDFEFLDTTGRRFEIYYDKNGRRPSRPTRPFYLEDLDRFEVLWDALKPLTKTQRRQVIHSIEATRERWHGSDHERKSLEDEVFEQFVADTLAGAAWPRGESPRAEAAGDDVKTRRWKELVRAGVRGELADLAELHMELLKE